MFGGWPTSHVEAALVDQLQGQIGTDPAQLGQVRTDYTIQHTTYVKGLDVGIRFPVPWNWQRRFQHGAGCRQSHQAGFDMLVAM